MKVIMVSPLLIDENKIISSQFVFTQAKALKEEGLDVAIISVDSRPFKIKRKLGIYKTNIDGLNIYVGSIPFMRIPFISRLTNKFLAHITFKFALRNFGEPDIIHSHFQQINTISCIVTKKKIPVLTTEHGSWLLNKNRTIKSTKYANKAYQLSDKVVCVSDTLKNSIESFWSGNIDVIPNIVAKNFAYHGLEKNSDFTFVYVGNFERHKNPISTIEAFALFSTKYPKTKLQIVGKGSLLLDMQKCIAENNLSSKVEILGFIDNRELSDVLNKAHCMCLPSNYETFGIVYIEANACGIPAIATIDAKTNGVITDENGVVIDEITVKSVYSAMCDVYENYERYDFNKISNDVLLKYSEKAVSKMIIEAYEGTINEKSKRNYTNI